jgi:hypothetical protein
MPIETTNRFYKSFSDIGIGDKVKYLTIDYQVFLRFDTNQKIVLINDLGKISTYNWEQLEIIDLMNE